MINKTIEIDIFNMKNIQGLWDKHTNAIERGLELGKIEVCERMTEKLIDYMIEYNLGDSKIINKVFGEVTKDGLSVGVNSEYAVFLEYGTGLAGEESPHPKPEGWEYNVGDTIQPNGGWWYPTTADDPNPHKREFNGQLWAWTIKGQASKPFLYKTWLWGSRSASNIIRKNINNELKKIGVK